MNEIEKVIKSRRSVFPVEFSDEIVPPEALKRIVESAAYAPNHGKTEPWRFAIFHEEEKEKLANELDRLYKKITPAEQFNEEKMVKTRIKLRQASFVITIVVNESGRVPAWEEVCATAMAVQNMWLTATSLGYGGYWSSPGTIHHLNEFLNLKENQKCIGLFYLGKPSEPFQLREKEIAEHILF